MFRTSGIVTMIAAAMAWAASSAAGAGGKVIPMPRMVVSKAATAPTIDGKIGEGEWDRAPACTAWVMAFKDELCTVQSVAWITYDDEHFYVCIKNNRGPKGTLLQKRARKADDAMIVFDPSNEIWLSPPTSPLETYQTLFNPYPGVFDAKMIPSVGYTAMSWQGKWEIASSENRDHWIVEARAPIKSFGFDRIKDGTTWRGLFCGDLGDEYGFRAWAPGGGFADLHRHGYMDFRDSSPVFQLLNVESVFTGKVSFPMAVIGPVKGSSEVAVSVRFGAGIAPAAGDLTLRKKVTVANGKKETFSLSGDLNKAGLTKGYCEVTAKTADGTVLYHQVFPFVVNGWVRTPPAEIKTTPYTTPFGLESFYAPLSKKLVVKADRLYMERRAEVAGGVARLTDPKTGRVVATRKIAPFYHDYSEFPMDLSALEVPVETEKDWAASVGAELENKKIAAENEKRKAAGKPEKPLKPVAPAKAPAVYDLEVVLTDAGGKKVAATTTQAKLRGYQFEWLPNQVGISDKVIPPWTPMKWSNGQISMWNKTYRLNGLGLAEKIVNDGSAQLSGPMRMIAVVDGREVAVDAGRPRLTRQTEAGFDLAGSAKIAGLTLDVKTRVEFDGFVLNTMKLSGRGKLDKLSLVVTMPAEEAPCFVTTSGGWSAYHGWTPDRWDSRETALGSMIGNFVPYVFLTDSERGFCWFADSDKGWILDPDAATCEMKREGGVVTFRVNFVTRPSAIDTPTTMTYGWAVTPQKPQPKGWRAYHIANFRPYPKARAVFWADGDGAILWAYYSSPFPRDYEKSKQMLAGGEKSGVVGCVGNIAHAIARYCDYKGRWFNEVAADWGSVPGDTSNGNVCRAPGPNDFQLWHWDQWVKRSGVNGLYFDETYLSEEWNYLAGNAYLLPDERVQPGYSYIGLRDMNKRLRYLFHANGREIPFLWLHTTGGQPVYAWMPDVAMEGENVEPAGLHNDYIDALPAGRLRSIGMGRNLGAAPIVMCQTSRHWNPAFSHILKDQFVGWVLVHDVLPEQVPFWAVLSGEMQMWRDEIRFLPYWKKGLGVESGTKDVLVSAHARPGDAVLWIVNTAQQARTAKVRVDLNAMGLAGKSLRVFDAETGEPCALAGGTLSVEVPKRMWRSVRLVQDPALGADKTFVASFDKDAEADSALGNPLPKVPKESDIPQANAKSMPLDRAIAYDARHNIPAGGRGNVSWKLKCGPESSGSILALPGLSVAINRGKLTVTAGKAKADADLQLGKEPAWHRFAMAWKGRDVSVSVDGKPVISLAVGAAVKFEMPRGIHIVSYHIRTNNAPTFSIGPVRGAAIDDLVISK